MNTLRGEKGIFHLPLSAAAQKIIGAYAGVVLLRLCELVSGLWHCSGTPTGIAHWEAKWNDASVDYIRPTSAFPALTIQTVCC